MQPGTKLQPYKLYYTKDGMGNVIEFNLGYNRIERKSAIMVPEETHSTDVWWAGISRNIKDIAETKEDAQNIIYGKK